MFLSLVIPKVRRVWGVCLLCDIYLYIYIYIYISQCVRVKGYYAIKIVINYSTDLFELYDY